VSIIVPTRYKAKLPGDLSFPLGAQAVSEALAGVPQFDTLTLAFSGPPRAFRDTLKAAKPYTVLWVSFTRMTISLSSPRSFIEEGLIGRKWEVDVYPVLRQHRHAVRTALLEHALPRARRWLADPRAASWQFGHRHVEFLFNPDDGSVSLKEFGEVLS
jgi:hypothetical protein